MASRASAATTHAPSVHDSSSRPSKPRFKARPVVAAHRTSARLAALLITALAPSVTPARAAPSAPTPLTLPHTNARACGRAAELIPVEAGRARAERIHVAWQERPQLPGWSVRVETTVVADEAVDLTLVLPAEANAWDRCATDEPLDRLTVGVQRAGQGASLDGTDASPADVAPWVQTAAPSRAYRVPLAPRAPVRVAASYDIGASDDDDWVSLDVASSAGRWSGPVGRVEYQVAFSHPPPFVLYPRSFALEKFRRAKVDAGRATATVLVFSARRLDHRADFHLVFPSEKRVARLAGAACVGLRGETEDAVVKAWSQTLTPAARQSCRDLALALEGFPFVEPDKRKRFYDAAPEVPAWARALDLAVAPRPVEPRLRDKDLFPGLRRYLELVTSAAAPPHPTPPTLR